MNKFKKLKFFSSAYLVIFALLSYQTSSAHADLFETYRDPQKNYLYNNEILNSTAKLFEEDGRPKASVGTVLYTHDNNGETYILIGRESSNKIDGGKYCELGGSVELTKKNKPESFLIACIRECEEESANKYKLDKNYVLKNSFTLFRSNPKREEVYIFLKAPNYVSASKLEKSVAEAQNEHSKEKDKFKWVKLADLLDICLPDGACEIQDRDNNREKINLRSYFLDMLRTEEVPYIFEAIKSSNSEEDKVK